MGNPVPVARSNKIYSEVIKVTPEMATKWLEGKVHNREVRDSVVHRYAEDMKAGRWGLTHQGLAFNPDGKLLDGQHRLWAIISANQAVWMTVAYNVPDEAQQYIDGGVSRTAVDVMRLADPDSEVTNFRMAIARQMLIGTRTQVNMSRAELIEFYTEHHKAIEFVVAEVFQGKKILRATPAPVAAVVGRAYYHEDKERLKEFGRILLDGLVKSPDRDGAAILLRNWLMMGSPTYDKTHRVSKTLLQYMKAQRALSAFLSGEQMRSLYPAKDEQWALPGEIRRQRKK